MRLAVFVLIPAQLGLLPSCSHTVHRTAGIQVGVVFADNEEPFPEHLLALTLRPGGILTDPLGHEIESDDNLTQFIRGHGDLPNVILHLGVRSKTEATLSLETLVQTINRIFDCARRAGVYEKFTLDIGLDGLRITTRDSLPGSDGLGGTQK